jgi:hypothetical protein
MSNNAMKARIIHKPVANEYNFGIDLCIRHLMPQSDELGETDVSQAFVVRVTFLTNGFSEVVRDEQQGRKELSGRLTMMD